MKRKRIILVGKAASGKDFFRDFCNKNGMVVDVGYTTRGIRDGEIHGYTYHYVEESEFLEVDFKEHVEFNSNRYGTSKKSWEDSQIFVMEKTAVESMSEEDRNSSVVIYFNVDKDVRLSRMSKRSDSNKIESRLEFDDDMFKDFLNWDINITNPKYSCIDLLNTAINFE